MGYRSNYQITIVGDPGETAQVIRDIEAVTGDSFEKLEDNVIITYDTKWPSFDEDLKEVALKHPDSILCVDVECEDRTDWAARFKGDENEIVHPITETPPFTRVLLPGEEAPSDSDDLAALIGEVREKTDRMKSLAEDWLIRKMNEHNLKEIRFPAVDITDTPLVGEESTLDSVEIDGDNDIVVNHSDSFNQYRWYLSIVDADVIAWLHETCSEIFDDLGSGEGDYTVDEDGLLTYKED